MRAIYALLALVYVVSGVTYYPMSALTTNQVVTVTSTPGADTTVPVLISLTGPTTFSAPGTISITANVTTTGISPVQQVTVYFTSTTSNFALSLDLGQSISDFSMWSTSHSSSCFPAETFTISLVAINQVGTALSKSSSDLQALSQWHQMVVSAGCPSASISSISIVKSASAACTGGSCSGFILGNITVTGSVYTAGAFLKPLVGGSDATLLVAGNPSGSETFPIANVVNSGTIPLISKFSLQQIPLNNFVPFTADWSSEYLFAIGNTGTNPKVYQPSDITAAGLGSIVTITNGGTDSTAPTCTSIAYSSQSITTTNSYVSVSITATCTDNTGGVGIAYTALLVSGTQSSGLGTQTAFFPVTANSPTAFNYVPPYFSGQFSAIGLIVVDNSGNTAFYGSCGTSDELGQLCPGGGGSGAASVAMSAFVAVLVVAVNFFSM